MPQNSAAAAELIREAAGSFAREESGIPQLWSAFHSNLHELCAQRPLQGEFLALFNAFETWEAASGPEKLQAVEHLHEVAARLANSATPDL